MMDGRQSQSTYPTAASLHRCFVPSDRLEVKVLPLSVVRILETHAAMSLGHP